MKRACIFGLGLLCLSNGYFGVALSKADIASELAELEELLDNQTIPAADQVDPPAFVDAVAQENGVKSPRLPENGTLSYRIAVLEQLLADRDAIILQLSQAQVPDRSADVVVLEQANQRLTAELAAAGVALDQIREDFDRQAAAGEAVDADTDADFADQAQLQARILQLETRLSEVTLALDDVVRERDLLASRVAASDRAGNGEVDQMQAELDSMRQVLDDLRVSLAASEAERTSMEEALQARTDRHQALLQEAETKASELADQLGQSEKLRIELEGRLAQNEQTYSEDEVMQELSRLQALDASRRVTMDDLLLQIGGLRDTLAVRDAELETVRETIAGLEAAVASGAQQIEERQARLSALGESKAEQEKLLVGAREMIEAQAVEISSVRATLAEQEAALAARVGSHQELEQQHGAIVAALADVRAERSRLAEDLALARKQQTALDAEIESKVLALDRAVQVEEQRRRVFDEMLGNLADLEEHKKVLLLRQAELEGALTVLEGERAALQGEVASLEASVALLQGRVAAEEAQGAGLRAALEDQERALADKATAYSQLQEMHEKVVAELSATTVGSETLQRDLGQLRVQLQATEETLASLQSELENTRLVDDRRRRTLDETLAQLAMAEQRQQEAQAQAAQAEARLQESEEQLRAQIQQLSDRNRLLEDEVTKMEQDVMLARAGGFDGADMDGALQARFIALEARNASLESQLLGLEGRAAGHTGAPVDAETAPDLEQALRFAQQEVTLLREALAAGVAGEEQVGDAGDIPLLKLQLREQEAAAEQATLRLDALQEELVSVTRELEAARRVDIRESDLYRELEESSGLLRETLVETESGRQRLQRSLDDLRGELEAARQMLVEQEGQAAVSTVALQSAQERETEYRELIDRLVPEVRDLEEKLTALRQEREVLASRLLQREDDIAALHVELEQREHRLARAERVAEVLERTRSEVEQSQRRQKLNMHYNMASVYARDGRLADAEQEYLQALRLDPSDADVHFNLGILYDDELGQPEKALLHYRRYLQLNPHGVDADRVRGWLMRLEMQQRR